MRSSKASVAPTNAGDTTNAQCDDHTRKTLRTAPSMQTTTPGPHAADVSKAFLDFDAEIMRASSVTDRHGTTTASVPNMLPTATRNAAEATKSRIMSTRLSTSCFERMRRSWISAHRSPWLRVVGVAYVAATLFGGTRFLATSSASLANDFLWVEFNDTGTAVFVAKAVNLVVSGINNATEYALTDSLFLTTDRFDQPTAAIPFSPHYGRLVQYHRLTGIEDALVGLRGTLGSRVGHIMTQYCWVDFDRRWSLAHTAERAHRCLESYRENGAVYLEAVMRNVAWKDYMVAYGRWFTAAVGNPLTAFDGGQAFLDQTTKSAWLSISDEATYWRSKGIKKFVLQYHNSMQIGVAETVDIINALGMHRSLTVKKSEFVDRWASKTSLRLYWFFINDLWSVADNNTMLSGRSIVRNSSNFYEKAGLTLEAAIIKDGVIDTPMTPQDQLLRATVGPFGSIDMFWTIFPAELNDFVMATRKTIYEATRASANAQTSYTHISTSINKMTYYPAFWIAPNRTFVGAGPLCSRGPPVPYVAQQFSFDDTCAISTTEGGYVDPLYYIISTLASGVVAANNSAAICAAGRVTAADCPNGFKSAFDFVLTALTDADRAYLTALGQAARRAVEALNVSIMQYAKTIDANGSATYQMLVHPVVTDDATNLWNAFGWFHLLDWVGGRREVVEFTGDAGTLVLLSGTTNPSEFPTNSAEIPRSMSVYLNGGLKYVTVMLLAVAALVLVYALMYQFRISGRNLIAFNRVTAMVWIGRPLLMLRGMIAICILSTARPVLVNYGHVSGMVELPSPWFANVLASGEATWVAYVILDLLLMWTIGRTFVIAPLSTILVWVIAFTLEVALPLEHRMTVDPKCTFVALERQVVCSSATIEIGFMKRAGILVIVVVASVACSWIVARVCVAEVPLRSDGALLPGIAQEVFERDQWVHNDKWFVDAASAAMAGLLMVPWRRERTAFDIQKWMMLHVKPQHSPREATTTLPPHLRQALQLEHLRTRTKA